ncbi:MAG: DUF2163 domain-containing protein [Proteobacteria bacterium]|nr:DUF2163 domain-containing protein [Pseudomonadota bacterium]
MSFAARETSIANGQPVRLYAFGRGPLAYRYTSADRDVSYAGNLYRAAAITDNGSQQTGEAVQDTFQITAPAGIEVAQAFAIQPPSQRVTLRVFDLHAGDSDAMPYWVGQITRCGRPDADGKVTITCESIVAAMQVNGCRGCWQKSCDHVIYDDECNALKEPMRVPATLVTVTANTLTAAEWGAFDDTWFPGGFVEFAIPGGLLERRQVLAQAGNVLTILGDTSPLQPGDAVAAFPGCDNTPAMCDGRFHNIANYGGIPGLPGKSPFSASPFV